MGDVEVGELVATGVAVAGGLVGAGVAVAGGLVGAGVAVAGGLVGAGVGCAGGGVAVLDTGVDVGALVAVGIAVGVAFELVEVRRLVATNEVYDAVIPTCVSMRTPTRPEEKALSEAVTIQLDGSALPVGHTLAESVEPEAWNRREYEVPAAAEKGAVPRIVVEPTTFF